MLVLTRKLGESIIVGDDVVISVESISGRKVKLGVQAPVEISIIRSEIKKLNRDDSCKPHESGMIPGGNFLANVGAVEQPSTAARVPRKPMK